MIQATVYSVASGRVKHFATVSGDDLAGQVGGGEGYIEGKYSADDFYVENGAALARSDVSATLDKSDIASGGSDAARLASLPDPCWLLVDGVETKVTGGAYVTTSAAVANIHIELIGGYRGGPWLIIAHDLSTLKVDVSDRIDASAETCRLEYITPGAGQAMVYTAKSDEAKAWLAATSPVDADYPLLSAEAAATSVTVATLAQSVASLTAQWLGLAAAIEALRIGGKQTVAAAATVADVLAAEAITWP